MKSKLFLIAVVVLLSTTNLFSQLSLEVVWEKQQGGVIDAKFSPDGKFVYCLIGGDIKKLDVQTGEFISTFNREGFTNKYSYLEISPNGNYIITGGYDGSVNLWNTEEQKIVRSLNIPEQTEKQSLVYSTFSPDNKTVLLTLQTSHDYPTKPTNEIVLYDFINNKIIKKVPYTRIEQLQYSKDGKYFITGTAYEENCRVTLWDAKEMTVIREYKDLGTNDNGFRKIQISDNNKLIGLSTQTDVVKIMDVETGIILQTNNPNTNSTIFSLLPFDYYLICEWNGDGTTDYSMNIYKYPNILQSSSNRYGARTIISKAIETGKDSNRIIIFLSNMTLLKSTTITSFPNIRNMNFNIKVEPEKISISFENADSIKIIDMKGNVLLDQKVNEPNITIPNTFIAGTYICVIKSGDREYSQKFLVVR